VQIRFDGHKHLGAAIGTKQFKESYISKKVEKWVADVKELASVATENPQLSYSAYTKGISHRWTYVQRTMAGISTLFSPLEECISEVLIPAITGRSVSPQERNMLALPVRFGGLGLTNPVECCDREYQASTHITTELSSLIFQQNQDLSLFNFENQRSLIKAMKAQKETFLKEKCSDVIASINNMETQRCIKLNQEKGSGSWLTVLPLADCGYTLNKQEFRDALCLRYGWSVASMPHFCGCGQKTALTTPSSAKRVDMWLCDTTTLEI